VYGYRDGPIHVPLQLLSLPKWVGFVESVLLTPNPLWVTPVRRPTERLALKFFQETLWSEGDVTVEWGRVKLSVLGQEGVGKTHFLHALEGLEYTLPLRTEVPLSFLGVLACLYPLCGCESVRV